MESKLEELLAKTIRGLAMDAVQQANSGHPGMPMGAADMAVVLWTRFLKHNPANPEWPDRDRFVLSAGHGSMLLYSLLHLTGYDLPLEELKSFRQWGSRTPGHPESHLTPGVETTTGPLGQGFANGVGMALAERMLAARFNRPGFPIVDHMTYGIVSDGDLMEGISHEAASLAGHLGLGKLIYLYDDNRITIEGSTDLTYSDDVRGRFTAYGWHVVTVDGHDQAAVAAALKEARAETEHPSLIIARTHIAYGSPTKQDSAEAHGSPLGPEEVRLTKERMGWPAETPFYIPEEVGSVTRAAVEAGQEAEARWRELFAGYAAEYPELAAEWARAWSGELPAGWEEALPRFEVGGRPMATRAASGRVMEAIAPTLPALVGGSADLHPSTKTYLKGYAAVVRGEFGGRNLHFGVREHGMAGILNGMALHRGVRPYGSTFLVFADYLRPSLRLAALMGLPVIYVFTHDSIGVGEDGPTHQPVEQLASLRAIPNLVVLRPADANETVAAWRVALHRVDGPTALVLTRQDLPILGEEPPVARGGYVVADAAEPDVVLVATGSEVHLALEARRLLAGEGIAARVVSLPSWELLAAQPADTLASLLMPGVPRVAVEAGVTLGWAGWTGLEGRAVGIDRFGASAPYQTVMAQLGLTVAAIAAAAREVLARAEG
jgi:transketolase